MFQVCFLKIEKKRFQLNFDDFWFRILSSMHQVNLLLEVSEAFLLLLVTFIFITFADFVASLIHRRIHIFHDNCGVVSVVLFFLSLFFFSRCVYDIAVFAVFVFWGWICVLFVVYFSPGCDFCLLFFLFCSFLWIKDDLLSELFSAFSIWCWWDVANSFQM